MSCKTIKSYQNHIFQLYLSSIGCVVEFVLLLSRDFSSGQLCFKSDTDFEFISVSSFTQRLIEYLTSTGEGYMVEREDWAPLSIMPALDTVSNITAPTTQLGNGTLNLYSQKFPPLSKHFMFRFTQLLK